MKMKRWTVTAMLVIVITVLAACGKQEYKPEAINEETDRCAICNMAVKDDQYATQIITTDGQSLKFDDIGCMNTWKKENGTATIGASFVRDYNSKQWLNYEKAYYVYDQSLKTPMAYGIVSFEKKEDAESFVKEQGMGKLMTAEELAFHSWEVNRDMMQGHEDSHDHSHDMDSKEHMDQGEHQAQEEHMDKEDHHS
ncbi:nitrous oxide reductase accessory protein NosL [Paenibacillus sp. J5C_2022]|uniref:nitrous oxide reductase accessory protein NosL n=1 Tax=Paenibacillus sp. J5C2022 TaxID=2977129 RepID=UPI0021D3A1B6|nr:nitrous oxide reductase accessory protein NosL [Paenibacillus sp. J5C2022]MCU6712009.1 nitrous oxide reductase accessory protein NosL [Paenibacillus sp. J5C2022]